jgi:hypothetical protein
MNEPAASAVSMGNEAKIGVLALTVLLVCVTVLGTSLVAAWTYPNSPNMTPPIVEFAFDEFSSSDPSHLGFHFSVTQPAWYKDNGSDVILTDVSYQLDSNEPIVLSTAMESLATRYDIVHNFSAYVMVATDQPHTLFLKVGLLSGYDIFSPGDPHGHFAKSIAWAANQTVNFTVDTKGAVASLNYTVQATPNNTVQPPSSEPPSSPSPPYIILTPIPGAATSTATETVTPSPTVSPTPSPTSDSPNASPSPTVPELTSIAVFALGAAACLTAVTVKRVKRNPT